MFTSSPTVQQCVKIMQSKLFLSLVLQERKQEEKKNSTIIVPLPIERKRNNGGESSGSNFFLSLRLVVKSLQCLSLCNSQFFFFFVPPRFRQGSRSSRRRRRSRIHLRILDQKKNSGILTRKLGMSSDRKAKEVEIAREKK
jgi:hypothetical protein